MNDRWYPWLRRTQKTSVLIKSKRWLKLSYRNKADVPLELVYYFAISQAIGRFITLKQSLDININSSYRYLYKNHRNQGIAALINIQILRLILQRYCTGTYIYMNVFMQELEFLPYGLITLKPHNYWNILPCSKWK